MVFDPQKLMAMEPIVTMHLLTARDTMLYALGVGATELDFVYEGRLKALPTMAVVMAYPGFIWADPLLSVDWKQVLHGEQSTRLHASLPVEGLLRGETRIEAIYDKGPSKGSIAHVVRHIYAEESGELLATVAANIFLRGDGGHGGREGEAPAPHSIPKDRQPDEVVTLKTAENQALVYRLSGDYNPLHIDPEIAGAAGFDGPILQGLCTYGLAGRAVISALCNNEPERLARLDVRFSSVVYPGETISMEIWRQAKGRAAFRAKSMKRDLVVLNNGYVEYS